MFRGKYAPVHLVPQATARRRSDLGLVVGLLDLCRVALDDREVFGHQIVYGAAAEAVSGRMYLTSCVSSKLRISGIVSIGARSSRLVPSATYLA